MKPQRADHIGPQPARVEFQVQFSTPHRVQRRSPDAKAPDEVVAPKECSRGRRWGVVPAGRPSKAALLLALAHHWELLVREGLVRDYAEIARLAGLTRARVTQIMNLTLLAPGLQEGLLFSASCPREIKSLSERLLRPASTTAYWHEQRKRFSNSAPAPLKAR